MKRNTAEPAPVLAQITYKIKGVTYVPHYRNSSIYVGPGYPRFTRARFSEAELLNAGAVAGHTTLWVRANHGIVTDINP
jgi:hypothetical protein